jgi:hypothetical protein
MEASFAGKRGSGDKGNESCTGCVLAAGCRHIAASLGARFETYEPFIYLIFKFVGGTQ